MPPKRNKPVRYWPGKAPAPEHVSTDDESESDDIKKEEDLIVVQSEPINQISRTISKEEAESDPRLRRLLQSRISRDEDGSDEDRRGRRRSSPVAPGGPKPVSREEDESEDEDAAASRRQRLREQTLQRRKEEEQALSAAVEAEEQSEESSEYTSDSEDDEIPTRQLLKPVFKPKQRRETILEKERLEKEAQEAEERKLQELEERKKESHNLVAEQLQKEQEEAEASADLLDVDDTDGLNDEEEYAAWRLRELLRIKRDREEQDARDEEKADIERRRNMSDKEIMAEKKKEGLIGRADKSQMRFMQKYYHRGAFFVDDSDVGKVLKERDFTAPTLEDKVDKSILPSVMQVKNFGRAGQTKWTHLAKEDTSHMESPWFQKTEVNKRTVSKMGGMKEGFDKPTAKRRKY
ncbi:splicing factor, Prp19-binding domain-containing protein [Gaertneriomyces semiglobifer]|nr:splicing factor, Prp19-binding domain-containing protein [Gaertneriomyces semiglobifer]